MVAWKVFVTEGFGKGGVIDAIILPTDSLFRHTGRATRFENIERFSLVSLRNPNLVGQVP